MFVLQIYFQGSASSKSDFDDNARLLEKKSWKGDQRLQKIILKQVEQKMTFNFFLKSVNFFNRNYFGPEFRVSELTNLEKSLKRIIFLHLIFVANV